MCNLKTYTLNACQNYLNAYYLKYIFNLVMVVSQAIKF